MHAPAEHTVEGQQYDLEMHFVHLINTHNPESSADGYEGKADFAVIGVFFDRSAGNKDNPFIDSLAASATVSSGETKPITDVNVADFLEKLDYTNGFYTYNGSFTTPPCTEGVKWVILNQV
mmetsp:Transcript_15752/g.21357  ORF Transcript_15752/g.21357 Transcript_15752/m.21357 type:complete len:121 (-) Transcript_15752:159-521(-)